MNNTRPPARPAPTRLRASAGLLGAAALVAGAAAQPPAGAPGPAARLKPAVPITPQDGGLVGRGSAPSDPAGFDRPRQPLPTTVGRPVPTPIFGGRQPAPVPLAARQPAPPQPGDRPSAAGRAWAGVRDLMVGKQPESAGLPAPRPVQEPARQAQPPARQPAAPGPSPTGHPTVYAGPPAYRWYGWGTVTPGANPYAPAGQYPRGSANWYAQTGATPGAFPVPVTSDNRPVLGPEPPAYAAGVQAPAAEPAVRRELRATPTSTRPPRPAAPPQAAPLPVAPAPAGEPPVGTASVPVLNFGPPQVGAQPPAGLPVPLAVVSPAAATAPPPPPGVTWQPSGGEPPAPAGGSPPAPPPTVTPPPGRAPADAGWSPIRPAADFQPVTRGQEPEAKPSAEEALVRAACHQWGTVTEVRVTAADAMTVRLTARTRADAKAAFEALSAVPRFDRVKIDFEADVLDR